MIKEYSRLIVADNSGAKNAMCIRLLGGSKKKYGSIGDIIVVTVKNAIPGSNVKKGDISKAVIVRTKKERDRIITWIEKTNFIEQKLFLIVDKINKEQLHLKNK